MKTLQSEGRSPKRPIYLLRRENLDPLLLIQKVVVDYHSFEDSWIISHGIAELGEVKTPNWNVAGVELGQKGVSRLNPDYLANVEPGNASDAPR